jgi:hypothetical protein
MSEGEGQTPIINIALLTEGGASRSGIYNIALRRRASTNCIDGIMHIRP